MYFRKQCLSPIRPVMMAASNISLIINVLLRGQFGVFHPAVAHMRVKFDFARGSFNTSYSSPFQRSFSSHFCQMTTNSVPAGAKSAIPDCLVFFLVHSILRLFCISCMYINLVYRIVLYCTPCTLLLISTS